MTAGLVVTLSVMLPLVVASVAVAVEEALTGAFRIISLPAVLLEFVNVMPPAEDDRPVAVLTVTDTGSVAVIVSIVTGPLLILIPIGLAPAEIARLVIVFGLVRLVPLMSTAPPAITATFDAFIPIASASVTVLAVNSPRTPELQANAP
jgi:hypothetical protein